MEYVKNTNENSLPANLFSDVSGDASSLILFVQSDDHGGKPNVEIGNYF
jgi:hypothetical protein